MSLVVVLLSMMVMMTVVPHPRLPVRTTDLTPYTLLTDTKPMTVQQYMVHANLAPLKTPVTWRDLWRFPTSSVITAPSASDVIITNDRDRWQFAWAYFTAVAGRDTLCLNLLGSDANLALTALGYHDQSDFDLTVTVVTIETLSDGRRWGGEQRDRPMTKQKFDRRYSQVFRELEAPFPAPQPNMYR